MTEKKGRRISQKHARAMLESGPHVHDGELSRRLLCEAIVFADGTVLLNWFNRRTVVYDSKADLVQFLADGAAKAEALRDVTSLLGDLDAFRRAAPEIALTLAPRLSLPSAVLDFKVQSLSLVERRLRRLTPKSLLTPELFTPLCAYVGEVVRRTHRGEWTLSPRRGDGTVTVRVVAGSHTRFDAEWLLTELVEKEQKVRLSALV